MEPLCTPHSEGTAGLLSSIRTGSWEESAPPERNQKDTGKNTQGAHRKRHGDRTESRPSLLKLGGTQPSDRSPELATGGRNSSNGQASEREGGRQRHQDTRMLELGWAAALQNRTQSHVRLQCEEEVCSWFFTAVLTRSSRLSPHRGGEVNGARFVRWHTRGHRDTPWKPFARGYGTIHKMQ